MSDSSSIASAEIADTLRRERNRFEQGLANFRVAGFALSVLSTAGVANFLTHPQETFVVRWGPVIYLSVAVVVAIGIRAWVRREGATDRVVYTAIVADLVLVGMITMVISLIAGKHDPLDPMDGANWSRHVSGSGLMFMVALNSMRWHASGAILAMILSLALYVANVAFFGPEPPHVMGATLLLMVGVLGVRIAGQQQQVLERFARSRLLRRFLPTAGVSAVEEGDDPYAIGTRAVTLTMMVTDLRGFTAMSEKLAPEVMVAQLNAYHGAMYGEIEGHGGMLEKFMGDGALAIFGWPSSPDCGAAAAVACGHAMLVRLAALNAERATAGDPPLAMGIGVHTGHVIAGAIGAPGRRVEFTFLGDAVNIASRIEGLTKSMKKPLLVSADTVARMSLSAARLPSTGALLELGAFEIRGRAEPVKLWGA